MPELRLLAPNAFPIVTPGDDLAALIADTVALEPGDIVVLAQKIVSKAENRAVRLDTVTPSPRAIELAQAADKDPRTVELMLAEAEEVMRVRPGVIIVRHRLGLVLANAGIDQSNIEDEATVLLLPADPDASAAALRKTLRDRTGADVAVLIIDSLGRAWRGGTLGTAIGVAGMPGLLDLRGEPDLYGRPLKTSELGIADEAAAAASLLMGQAGEGRPLVVIRGLARARTDGNAAELVRPRSMDLFP